MYTVKFLISVCAGVGKIGEYLIIFNASIKCSSSMPVFQEGPMDKLPAFTSLQVPIYEESKKKALSYCSQ